MEGTKKSIAQNQQQFAKGVAEEALEIVIKNVALAWHTIKDLRETCKRIKVAADARVQRFTLSLNSTQDFDSVQHSGLLKGVTKLNIYSFDVSLWGDGTRALGLLNLAVDVCSKFITVLEVEVSASPDMLHACASVLGTANWESLEELELSSHLNDDVRYISGFLSGLVSGAQHGSLPALKVLRCNDPSAADIKALYNPGYANNLTTLSIRWSSDNFASNSAPATVAAMRNLLQKSTNLDFLSLTSNTFDFFGSEQLNFLENLHLSAHSHRGTIDFAPVLALPWPMLKCLKIRRATLKGPDVVRIFEAEDTLPVLQELVFNMTTFIVDALSSVRRPHLEYFHVRSCTNGHELVFKLAQLMNGDTHVQPKLKRFCIQVRQGYPSPIEPLSKFLSCPCMASLETLSIMNADIGVKGTGLLCVIMNCCPNLKHLDLRFANLQMPTADLFAEYGRQGAWPHLEQLGIVQQGHRDFFPGPRGLAAQRHYQSRLENTLQDIWPGLECF